MTMLPRLREDRPGRGGDQQAFLAAGIPAVRFIEVRENAARQHSPDDVPAHVSSEYVARVTQVVTAVAAVDKASNAPRRQDRGPSARPMPPWATNPPANAPSRAGTSSLPTTTARSMAPWTVARVRSREETSSSTGGGARSGARSAGARTRSPSAESWMDDRWRSRLGSVDVVTLGAVAGARLAVGAPAACQEREEGAERDGEGEVLQHEATLDAKHGPPRSSGAGARGNVAAPDDLFAEKTN